MTSAPTTNIPVAIPAGAPRAPGGPQGRTIAGSVPGARSGPRPALPRHARPDAPLRPARGRRGRRARRGQRQRAARLPVGRRARRQQHRPGRAGPVDPRRPPARRRHRHQRLPRRGPRVARLARALRGGDGPGRDRHRRRRCGPARRRRRPRRPVEAGADVCRPRRAGAHQQPSRAPRGGAVPHPGQCGAASCCHPDRRGRRGGQRGAGRRRVRPQRLGAPARDRPARPRRPRRHRGVARPAHPPLPQPAPDGCRRAAARRPRLRPAPGRRGRVGGQGGVRRRLRDDGGARRRDDRRQRRPGQREPHPHPARLGPEQREGVGRRRHRRAHGPRVRLRRVHPHAGVEPLHRRAPAGASARRQRPLGRRGHAVDQLVRPGIGRHVHDLRQRRHRGP